MSAGISLCAIPGGKLQLPALSKTDNKKVTTLLQRHGRLCLGGNSLCSTPKWFAFSSSPTIFQTTKHIHGPTARGFFRREWKLNWVNKKANCVTFFPVLDVHQQLGHLIPALPPPRGASADLVLLYACIATKSGRMFTKSASILIFYIKSHQWLFRRTERSLRISTI